MIPEISFERYGMRKTILTILAITVVLAGMSPAQSDCDQLYIKAMQANAPAERAKLLKEYLASCSGKGSQYENFANAFLCTGAFPKTDQETIAYGEKALALGGLDDAIKSQIVMTLASVCNKINANDKTKTYAQQLIKIGQDGKAKEPEGANWNTLIGVGHFLVGQAQQKSNDVAGALASYQTAYSLVKDVQILNEVKKMGKAYMDAKKYADAEKVYRFLAETGKDPDSVRVIADILVQTNRKGEALQMFKDMYAKKKSADMANNIGILLAQESKANPAVIPDAVNYLLDASLLYTNQGQAQKARKLAEGLFMSQDKEWNNRVKAIQESQKLIDDWTKTINTKFGNKSEDDLTPDERREYRKIKEVMDEEIVRVQGIQAQQKATMGRFETLLAQAKRRVGAK
jgi:tetratricopeptide (TPR) repeat protein